MKGIANHHDPESCLDIQQWYGDALTGENTGALLSSEITTIRRQTLYNEGECNINNAIMARYVVGCGGVNELKHVRKLSTRESGDPASTLVKGKREKGSINEGENPTN